MLVGVEKLPVPVIAIGRESRRTSDPVLFRQKRTVADPPEEDVTLDAPPAWRDHTSVFTDFGVRLVVTKW